MEAKNSYPEVARDPRIEPMIHDVELLVDFNFKEFALGKPS
jgi:hypothetical protein